MSNPTNPFATAPKAAAPTAAPTAAPVTPAPAPAPAAAPAAPVVEVTKEKKKKEPDPNYKKGGLDDNDMNYIVQNWKTSTPKEIAAALGCAKAQVSQFACKFRNAVKEKMKECDALPDNDPRKAQIKAQLEAKMDLMPAKEKGGAKGEGSGNKVENYITNLMGDIAF